MNLPTGLYHRSGGKNITFLEFETFSSTYLQQNFNKNNSVVNQNLPSSEKSGKYFSEIREKKKMKFLWQPCFCFHSFIRVIICFFFLLLLFGNALSFTRFSRKECCCLAIKIGFELRNQRASETSKFTVSNRKTSMRRRRELGIEKKAERWIADSFTALRG